MLEVSAATGVRWAQAWRARGSTQPGKVGGHLRPLLENERDWLMARIEQKKDPTLYELLADLREERGVVVCCDTLWRFLGRCGKTFKKDALRQRARPSRCRPPPQSLALGPALGRPQAHGLYRRDLGQDQHDAHPWLVHEGRAADR
jgi:putative transposase